MQFRYKRGHWRRARWDLPYRMRIELVSTASSVSTAAATAARSCVKPLHESGRKGRTPARAPALRKRTVGGQEARPRSRERDRSSRAVSHQAQVTATGDNPFAGCVGIANDAKEFALWLSPHIIEPRELASRTDAAAPRAQTLMTKERCGRRAGTWPAPSRPPRPPTMDPTREPGLAPAPAAQGGPRCPPPTRATPSSPSSRPRPR